MSNAPFPSPRFAETAETTAVQGDALQIANRRDVFDFFVSVPKSNNRDKQKKSKFLLPPLFATSVPRVGALAFGLFISPCLTPSAPAWAQTSLVDPAPSTLRSAARPRQSTQTIPNVKLNTNPTVPSNRGLSPLNPERYVVPQGATSSPFPQPAPTPVPPPSPFGPLNSPSDPATYVVPQGATSVDVPNAATVENAENAIEATRFSSGLYGDPSPNAPSPFAQSTLPLFFPASAADAAPSVARARLEELAWAVGCWELETNGFVFQTKIDWAPGGSYLLCQDFVRPSVAPVAPASTPKPNADAPSATPPRSTFAALRVVGWNPVAGLYQTSIFCRDGSYGTGLWQREGESWRVATRILLVDGRAATSVEYFSPRPEGGFAWESTSRTVENTPLPNVGPAQARQLSAEEFKHLEKSAFKTPIIPEAPTTQSEFE